MRSVQALGVAILLAAAAAPVLAQTDTDLCLRVQAAPDANLTDASAVQEGIGTGAILVTKVIPCEAGSGPQASAMPVADVGTGAWIVVPVEVDPLTDKQEAVVYLEAESQNSATSTPIRLWVDCTDGSTDLTVGWRSGLGTERLIDVDTRIGDGQVTTDRWFNVEQIETDYGGATTTFIKSLFGETRLTVGLKTPQSREITAVFDISGIENAVANVRGACGW